MAHLNRFFTVVPLASRSPFSARSRLRVIEQDSTERFVGIHDLTRTQISECSDLADKYAEDPTSYLIEYCGMPGIVKGVSVFGSGMTVYSENLKFMTVVCSSRVVGNKIKFGYGSEEFKQDRKDCWEFCVKRERIEVITKYRMSNPQTFPFELARPDETRCPCCMDDLSGNVVSCLNKHQVCLKCWYLLAGTTNGKKCPLCNSYAYSPDELLKIAKMRGEKINEHPFFFIAIYASNSHKEFMYNESLFVGNLKHYITYNRINTFPLMLLSSLINYYIDHRERGQKEFNFLNQMDGNRRSYNPKDDDLPEVVCQYINDIDSSLILKDVVHTQITMGDYHEIDFNKELEDLEKENAWNRIKENPGDKKELLKREIHFRYRIKNTTAEQFINLFKTLFLDFMRNSKHNPHFFKHSDIEDFSMPENLV